MMRNRRKLNPEGSSLKSKDFSEFRFLSFLCTFSVVQLLPSFEACQIEEYYLSQTQDDIYL